MTDSAPILQHDGNPVMEFLEWLFFGIRLYTVIITCGAGIIVYKYRLLVQNANFANFADKFWALLLVLSVQGALVLFQGYFPLTPENMVIMVGVAILKSWIFFSYLPMYLKQKKMNHTPFDDLSLDEKVKRSQDILDYH